MDARHRLAANLRRLRRERGLSQEQFALEHGIDRTYVSGVERGERNPTLVNVSRLAGALGVELTVLLEGVPTIKPEA